jgi:phage shock protein E
VPVQRKVLGAGLLSVVLMVAGCGGGDDRASPARAEVDASPALVGPDVFAGRIEAPGVVTINVHTPDEGSISGTDLTIPFDQIRESPDLPADRDTPLAIYCRSDNMSADAVDDLVALGYTDIVELDGGFNAWVAAGRPLQPAAD